MLGARHVELACRDLPVADQPAVLLVLARKRLQRVVSVEGRDDGPGAVAAPGRVHEQAASRRDELEAV